MSILKALRRASGKADRRGPCAHVSLHRSWQREDQPFECADCGERFSRLVAEYLHAAQLDARDQELRLLSHVRAVRQLRAEAGRRA